MTEMMMMMPDEGLADRLLDVRYDVAPPFLRDVANYDGRERMRLRAVAAGAENMTAAAAKEMLVKWRDTIANYTAGISDNTLLDDLEAWIERCAKPPFDPAPVVEGLIADIERVTRGRLGGLSDGERVRVAIELGATFASDPYCQAAYDAVRSFNRDRG